MVAEGFGIDMVAPRFICAIIEGRSETKFSCMCCCLKPSWSVGDISVFEGAIRELMDSWGGLVAECWLA